MRGANVEWSSPRGADNTVAGLTTTTLPQKGPVMAIADSTVVYKDIPGFPGYRVGDDGSVWSQRQKGAGYGRLKPWTPVATRPNKYGYTVVTLYHSRRQYNRRIARLVLEAFVGPCPDGMEACHFPDPCRSNNALANLRWGTPAQNAADRDEHGHTCRGEASPLSRLNVGDVRLIRTLGNSITERKEIAWRFGVTPQAIYNIQTRRTWKHL